MFRALRSERGITTPGTLLAVAGVGAILTGSFLYSHGLVRVSVNEKRPGGDHISLFIPGAVVPVATAFVPAQKIGQHLPPEARQVLPVALAALRELRNLPDSTLVQVDSDREHVRVRLENGSLMVDVDSDDEEVHVSLPLRTMNSVLAKLESAARYAPVESARSGSPEASLGTDDIVVGAEDERVY
jgi:hypothetical protein